MVVDVSIRDVFRLLVPVPNISQVHTAYMVLSSDHQLSQLCADASDILYHLPETKVMSFNVA